MPLLGSPASNMPSLSGAGLKAVGTLRVPKSHLLSKDRFSNCSGVFCGEEKIPREDSSSLEKVQGLMY